MAEYEPDDSRIITNRPSRLPIEPKRTGPREEETRQNAQKEFPDLGTGNLREPGHEGIPNAAANELHRWDPRYGVTQDGRPIDKGGNKPRRKE